MEFDRFQSRKTGMQESLPLYSTSDTERLSAIPQTGLGKEASGTPLLDKELSRRDVYPVNPKPYLPPPFCEQRVESMTLAEKLTILGQGSLLADVEGATERNPAKMLERLEKQNKTFLKPFVRPKLLAPDIKNGDLQVDLKVDDKGQPLFTFCEAMRMLRLLQEMKQLTDDRVVEQRNTKEARELGFLTHLRLEELHCELVALARYYCDPSPASYRPTRSNFSLPVASPSSADSLTSSSPPVKESEQIARLGQILERIEKQPPFSQPEVAAKTRQLEDRLKALEEQKEQERVELQKKVSVLEEERQGLKKELELTKEELSNTVQDFRDLNEQQKKCLKDQAHYERRVNGLEKTVDELRQKLDENPLREPESRLLEEKVKHKEKELATAKAQVQTGLEQIAELQQLLNHEQEQVTLLLKEFVNKRSDIDKEIRENSQSLTKAQDKLSQNQEKIKELQELNEALQRTVDAADAAKDKAEKALSAQVQAKNEAEQKLVKCEAEIAAAKAEGELLAHLNAELTSAHEELSDAREREEQLREQAEQSKHELESEKEKLKAVEVELKSSQDKESFGIRHIEELEAKQKELEDKVVEYEEKMASLQNQLVTLKDLYDKNVSDSKDTLEKASEGQEALQIQLTERNRKVSELESQLEDTRKLIADHHEESERQNKELAEAERKAQKKAEELKILSDERLKNIQKNELLNRQLEEQQKKTELLESNLEKQVEEARQERKKAEESVQLLETQIEEDKKELLNWEEKLRQVSDESSRKATEQQEDMQQLTADLQEKISQATEKAELLEAEKQIADSELKKIGEEKVSLEDELTAVRDQLEQLQGAKNALEQNLTEARETIDSQSSNLSSAHNDLLERQTEQDHLSEKYEALKKSHGEQQAKSQEVLADLNQAKESEVSLQKEVAELQKQVSSLKSEKTSSDSELKDILSAKESELASAQKEKETLTNEYKQIADELKTKQNALESAQTTLQQRESELQRLKQARSDELALFNKQDSEQRSHIKELEESKEATSSDLKNKNAKLIEDQAVVQRQLDQKVKEAEAIQETSSNQISMLKEQLEGLSQQLQAAEKQSKEESDSDLSDVDSQSDHSRRSSVSRSDSEDAYSSDDSGIGIPSGKKQTESRGDKSKYTDLIDVAPILSKVKTHASSSKVTETLKVQQVVSTVETAWDNMQTDKSNWDNHKSDVEVRGLALEALHTKATYSAGLIDLYKPLGKKIKESRETYEALLGKESSDPVYDQLVEAEESIDHNIEVLDSEVKHFNGEIEKLQRALIEVESNAEERDSKQSSESIIDDALKYMGTVVNEHGNSADQDLSTKSLCVIAESLSSRLVKAWGRELEALTSPDSKHEAIHQYLSGLKRLTPDNLPPSIRKRMVPLSRNYFLEVIQVTGEKLRETLAESHDMADGVPEEVTPLEVSMLQDPGVVARVLTLIGSLKDHHEGLEKNRPSESGWQDYDYAKASLAGLRRIRDEFGLPGTAMMNALLPAIISNLERDDSLVLAEALKQHHGKYKAKGMQDQEELVDRRNKLKEHCQKLLDIEKNLTPEQQLRGVSHKDGERVDHPNQGVLKTFFGDHPMVSTEDIQTVEGGLHCRKLKNASTGLLNGLLGGMGGSVIQKVSPLTGDAVIELQKVKCHPTLVFSSRNQKDWQVVLNGTSWKVDPTFLLDNPNFRVPFETNVSGQLQRDWVPLRNASGEATILVIQKTPPEQKCYLYEMGDQDNLVPIPIQGGNPLDEIKRATFLVQACQLVASKSDSHASGILYDNLSEDVKAVVPLKKSSWLKGASNQQLEECYKSVCQQVEDSRSVEPFAYVAADQEVRNTVIRLPKAYEIIQKKSGKERTGAKLDSFDAPKFESFSVDASFDLVTDAYQKAMVAQLKFDDGSLEATVEERKKFSREAFKAMTVFSGCELVSARPSQSVTLRQLKDSRRSVAIQLDKVIKSNQSHCMRMAQHKDALETALIKVIRENSEDGSKVLSDRELLDYTIKHFERGQVAQWMKQEGFIERLVELMLTEIDLDQRARLSRELDRLKLSLEALDYQAFDIAGTPDEYRKRCQAWNLEMALLATKQQSITGRIQSYENQQLTPETMALLCFERRHKIVLSTDQADELKVVLEKVHRWAEGDDVSVISHKGTGYGKSTILLALTDSAASLLGARQDRSVIVVAPESNQAELDILLGRYYARKGLHYQRLDMASHFAPPRGEVSVARLQQVRNVLLGVPPETQAEELENRLRQPRAPVGASITDIQVLMQLRHAVQQGTIAHRESAKLLYEVDACLDILRNSMLFADEFDSAMMPHSEQDLQSVADKVAGVLKTMTGSDIPVRPADIVVRHSEFVLGCKAKSLLSATVATPYTLSLVSGANTPARAKELARTDPFTTTPRFWHFMSQAEPVFYSSTSEAAEQGVFKQVLNRVGGQPQVVYFDGLETGEQCRKKAIAMSKAINEARRALGAEGKAVVYYDDQKHLQLQRDQDQKYDKGASVTEDMELLLRRTGCQEADGYLTQAQSVGTDIPQGIESVGVFNGVFHKPEQGNRAREDLLAQRLGRLIRSSKDLHKTQRLFVAVDLVEISQLRAEGLNTSAFDKAYEQWCECEALLFGELGVNKEKLEEPLKTVILKPLKIKPADWHEADKQKAVEALLDKEVGRLEAEEWQQLKLSEEQLSALKTVKRNQWLLKKCWLELMAEQVTQQEVNPHTMKCEEYLVAARVNSCLDRVFAEELNWLQEQGVKLVQSCEVGQHDLSERSWGQVVPAIRTTLENRLLGIKRRTHGAEVMAEQLSDVASFASSRMELQKVFSDIRQNGVALVEQDVVVKARNDLIEESKKGLSEALERVTDVFNTLKGAGQEISGIAAFSAVLKNMKREIALLDGDIADAQETAFKTEETIKKAYTDVMKAMMKVVLTEKGSRVVDEEIIPKLKKCVVWSRDYTLTSNKVSINRTKVLNDGMQLPKASSHGDNFYKFRWYITEPQTNSSGKKMTKLLDTKNKQFDKAEGNFSHKKEVMANHSDFKIRMKILNEKLHEQSELQEAKLVCSTPQDPRFKGCVEEVEQSLMAVFEQMVQQQEQFVSEEQTLMLEQSKLRQRELFQSIPAH